MGYKTVRNGVIDIVEGLKYKRSKDIVNFEDAAPTTFGKTFILRLESGEMVEEDGNTLYNKFRDSQEWLVLIAFNRSENNDVVEYDEMLEAKDTLIEKLDNKDNWQSYVTMQEYVGWEVEEFNNYFVLTIRLRIKDTITYT